MEKIIVSEELRSDYKKLIQAAQNIEAAVGGAYCKLNKMVEVRRQVDDDLKTWWEKVSEAHKIDKTKDYFVDKDGAINLVERPEAPAPAVPEAPVSDPDVVSQANDGTAADLK